MQYTFFLNSTLNPVMYFWRQSNIRQSGKADSEIKNPLSNVESNETSLIKEC